MDDDGKVAEDEAHSIAHFFETDSMTDTNALAGWCKLRGVSSYMQARTALAALEHQGDGDDHKQGNGAQGSGGKDPVPEDEAQEAWTQKLAACAKDSSFTMTVA